MLLLFLRRGWENGEPNNINNGKTVIIIERKFEYRSWHKLQTTFQNIHNTQGAHVRLDKKAMQMIVLL